MSPSTRSTINVLQGFSFLQILQENGHTDDECYKLHEFLKNATLVTRPISNQKVILLATILLEQLLQIWNYT